MKRSICSAVVFLSLLVACTLVAFGQGLYWESTTSGGPMGDQSMMAQYSYMPRMFKVAGVGPGEEVMIFRLDKEMLYTVQPKDKTYSEMTFAELEAAMKKMSAKTDTKVAELQEKMKNMPEDQRKMMEGMLGKMGTGKEAKMDVQNTGETKTIDGYSCTKFVITQDGKEFMTIWATKAIGMDAMRKDMEEFTKRMMAMNPAGMKGLAEAMKKVEGFGLETEMMQGMKQTVTKIEKKNTPASEFTVPAGFKKVPPKWAEADEKAKE